MTAENWEKVLPRFYGLSRREAMEVVATLQPHPAPPVRTVVTAVRSGPVSRSVAPSPQALPLEDAAAPQLLTGAQTSPTGTSPGVTSPDEVNRSAPAASTPSVTPARPLEIGPLSAEQSRLHLTVSKAFIKKLEEARDALSHAMPGATPEEILEAGLELLLARAAKRRGLVEKPRKSPRPSKGDHIPAHVRREVWKRDGGNCQWPLASGGICSSTRNLELDHIRPRSLGGASTADNLRVVCKAHNDLAARLALGDDLMDRYGSGPRGTARRSRSARANDDAPATSRA